MKNKSVFIIDESIDYINKLSKDLTSYENIYIVGYSTNGEEALEKLKIYREIDLLIIDMTTPGMNGYQILQEIKNNKSKYPLIKSIISQSDVINDYSKHLAEELGSNEFFRRPTNIDLILKVLFDSQSNEQNKANSLGMQDSINKKITRIMHTVGIPAHVKGYHFIREAIEMVIANPALIGQITKTLYPEIAIKFHTSTSKVERAIRHAIEIGWNRGNSEAVDEIFGYTISSNKCKPTNSEFIAMIADYIIINEENDEGMINKPIYL